MFLTNIFIMLSIIDLTEKYVNWKITKLPIDGQEGRKSVYLINISVMILLMAQKIPIVEKVTIQVQIK